MDTVETNVGAYERKRLERLSQQPNTTVFKTEYDATHTAWKSKRLRTVAEGLASRVTAFGEDVSDFQVRKRCLDDPEVLRFQREHPKLYWMLTDRRMVRDSRFQQALGGMFRVREQVEAGVLTEGRDADAMATSSIVTALQSECTPGQAT